MMQDPIIKEIHDIRKAIETDCRNDSQKYFEHLRDLQEQFRTRLVCREPKPSLRPQKIAVA